MIQAFFSGQSTLVVATAILCLLAAVATYVFTRQRHPRPVAVALFTASVIGALCLTFSGSSGNARDTCVYNRQILHDLLTAQGLLNVALFVPVGFLTLLAFRLPLLAVAGPAVLSLSIEVIQATVPPLARTCDSTDFIANSTGAILGSAAAWGLLRLSGRPTQSFRERARPVLWATGAVCAANVIAGAILITPVIMDGDTVRDGTSAMQNAVEQHLAQAFGNHYRISNIQYDPAGRIVYAALDGGSAQLDWPGQRDFTVSLIGWQKGIKPAAVGSYPVATSASRPKSKEDAQRIAQSYLVAHYPHLLKDAMLATAPVADARLGWATSVRRIREGILMPMRVDVGIDGMGRVSDLLVRDISDPANLPAPRLTEKQAQQAVRRNPDLPDAVTDIGKGTLIASKSADGNWRPVWLFPTGVHGEAGPIMSVDAVTGKPVTTRTGSGMAAG